MTKHFWERYFTIYDVLNTAKPYRLLLGKVCDSLAIRQGDVVLESGCGTGNLCVEIKRRGGDVIGIDNNKTALEICKNKDPSARIIQADLSEELPFPDSYFNKIACVHTFYWISENKRRYALEELLRVLKRRGLIAFVNPRENFSPMRIYIETIKATRWERGLLSTASLMCMYGIPSIKVLWYSMLLLKEKEQKKGAKGGMYISERELEHLLTSRGCNILEARQVYANQSILILAQKT